MPNGQERDEKTATAATTLGQSARHPPARLLNRTPPSRTLPKFSPNLASAPGGSSKNSQAFASASAFEFNKKHGGQARLKRCRNCGT